MTEPLPELTAAGATIETLHFEAGKLAQADALESAPMPFAIMGGREHTVYYANAAMCRWSGKGMDDILGKPVTTLLPAAGGYLPLLDDVFRTGQSESYTESDLGPGPPGPLERSYEIWPFGRPNPRSGSVVMQITETERPQAMIVSMNEALLLGALRQNEFAEAVQKLNEELQSEIKERKRAEIEVEHLAYYDPLTNLPNRRLLMSRLEDALLQSTRTGRHGAVFFIDLDDFKHVNDTLGHDFGDVLLQQVAHRLSYCVRETDTVARLGGDEFVILLQGLGDTPSEAAKHANLVGEKVLAACIEPCVFAGRQYNGAVSIGATVFSPSRAHSRDLLKQADLALYRAKSEGRGRIRFFNSDMRSGDEARIALGTEIEMAIVKHQFVLHYQPQVDKHGRLIGAEALLRWQHPTRGLLGPMEFIPLAEESGIIKNIDCWVAETALRQLAVWSSAISTAHMTLSVNVSPNGFGDSSFAVRLLAAIHKSGVDPTKVFLEFTERVTLGPIEETIAKMLALKAHGVRFALDDFGIGYSSFNYLKVLPLDQLKVDRSFIRDIPMRENDAAIATSIIDIGKRLGLSVVAEGVETAEQRDYLTMHGCDVFQGYFFGRPAPISDPFWQNAK